MKVILYTGTLSGGGSYDAWEQKSRAFATLVAAQGWALDENAKKVTEGIWGRRWVCVIESQDVFSDERLELERLIVLSEEKLSVVVDVNARRLKLQETGLRF